MTLPLLHYDRSDDRRLLEVLIERLRGQVRGTGELAELVARIVEDVRREGDEAIVRYTQHWTDPDFTAEMIRVSPEQMARAADSLEPALRQAMTRSIEHVRAYQQHILPAEPGPVHIAGAELGLRFTAIERAGLHVPGGRAAYPSSVIMQAVPAQVAGVGQLSLVSPPPTLEAAGGGPATAPGERSDISPLVLAACHMLGLERVYRIGGAQAIAALGVGTETVEPVDFIAGPGNAYTQQAKRQLFGEVGIDGFFGPSEIVILADASANAEYVAADLLAQAEHDPGCCFLVSKSEAVIEAVIEALNAQLASRTRQEAIEPALREWSAAVVVDSDDTAYALLDQLAAEHVTLAVADPPQALKHLRHGGAFFLGDQTPVASGDYYAGPSHCLPTGTTARYSSGLSVYNFLKRSSIETYPQGLPAEAIEDIARFAEAETLDAHAASARARKK